jgi:2-keto-4-pentenoate hydratase/2-oxohepta-3-ene-1,7-dioic acid hydratase in catechol pathway
VSYLGGAGGERLGALAGDVVVPLTDLRADAPATMDQLLVTGPSALQGLAQLLEGATGEELSGVRLLPPVPRPRNIVCVGRNYRDHAAEEGVEAPKEPALFLKHTASLAGPGDDIEWDPAYATQVDFEAELAVVIGREARDVDAGEALDYVLGYTCCNDVSARDLQFGDVQWTRGKSLATFCPLGPELVTPDEVPDPQALAIRCLVNGRVMQQASTADMFHSVADVISYASRAFALLPGDVIATGTPGGVGIFRDPPELLSDGDEVVVEVQSVGRLVNRCRTVGAG